MSLSKHLSTAKQRSGQGIPLPRPTGVKPRVEITPPPLPQASPPGKRILAQEELEPLTNLLLFAEAIVQGWFSGKHRSLEFGSNAEFVEHKAYVPGDPVAHIDWKVYARSRKLMIRKHRDEKEMAAYLLVDGSASMDYRPRGRDSKAQRAARIAAALSYLMQRQGDKFSLTYFSTQLGRHIPPGGTRLHLFNCLTELENRMELNRGQTTAHAALDLCVPLFKRRGCIVVISDFFTDLDKFFDAIAQFQHRKFEILLLHIMDPDERLLPSVPLARFVDMETSEAIQVDPDEIRIAYQKEMEEMMKRLETEAKNRNIDYRILKTEDPYRDALEAWMVQRTKAGRRAVARK